MLATKWTVWVEAAHPDGTSERHEVGSVRRDLSSPDPADFGLHLAEAQGLMHELQLRLVQDQVGQASALDRICTGCGTRRALHDHRRRVVATLFGRVATWQPRWRPCRCGRSEVNAPGRVRALLSGRATPELVRVQAEVGARLSFREAARVIGLLLQGGTAANHTSVRRHLAETADRLQAHDDASPHRISLIRGSPVVVSLDGAHVRAVPGCQTRHFAVAPNVLASRPGTIGNALRAQGWLPGRNVTVLSDGDSALVGAVRSATRETVTHILDWFHISMRVRHVEQAHAGLLGSDLEHKGPLWYAQFDVERLRHLIWNGYGDEARRALPGIVQMAGNAVWLNGKRGRARIERFAQLARELETYLDLNAGALVDYGRRQRAGLPIATSCAESTVNSLVNTRMNKRRQMRWSPLGAHRVLQVRAAVIDGRLGAGQLRLAA